MTYETSNKDATEFVKSGIWTHTFSQEPELESGALCIKKETIILYVFYISHPYPLRFCPFWTLSKYLLHLLCSLMQNVTHVIIVIFVSLFKELFLCEGFHIFCYMYVDIITQIYACMNILNEACMLLFFGGNIWHMIPPAKT